MEEFGPKKISAVAWRTIQYSFCTSEKTSHLTFRASVPSDQAYDIPREEEKLQADSAVYDVAASAMLKFEQAAPKVSFIWLVSKSARLEDGHTGYKHVQMVHWHGLGCAGVSLGPRLYWRQIA
ncbi:hypothetical protein H6P81_007736 [Aristolochia fimbriata]|uniref:Uncharacterized protein n=1 Tax=Aristolochia fimbriata TaxID=158543 RepID=A0AAV7F4W8_ARIFI|nr:hypothetical protein H6P81_007736 [Aristolochia fimbriata]